MPYTALVWQDGVTPGNQTNLNHLESQYLEATKSNNQDLLSAYVMNGLAVTRHNSYAAAVLADAPVRYYRLDEASGTSAADSSGNAQTATYVNGPTLNVAGALTGDPDAAITLASASSQRVSVPNTGLPTGNAAMTLECWFKFAANPAAGSFLFGYGNTATQHQALQLYVRSDGHLAVDTSNGSAALASISAVTTGAWHHAVATWDGTTLTLYLDGISQGTATPGAQSIQAGFTFNIGATSAPGNYWNGQIDEAAVYSGALSSTRITAHYTAGTTATTQVDMTSGTVYPLQSSDNTTRQRAISSASFTTVTPSTTYYLDANPDGTTSWGTSHSAQANYLPIAQVTTDGSGNVNVITDKRNLVAKLLPNASGGVSFPAIGGQATVGSFGAPVIIAQSLRNSITSTAQQTLLTVTLPANGTYCVRATVYIGNTTANQAPSLKASFTNCKGNADFVFMTGLLNNGSAVVGLDGSHDAFPTSQATVNVAPVTAEMNAGPLTVTYTASGTPNDVVSVIVERLA